MKMEFKRSINNKTSLIILSSCVLSFILGFILLISLDKLETISLGEFWYSAYTVYTQFGFLIFSVIVIITYNIDYREKNILFYKMLQINVIKYFLSKLVVIIFWFTVGTIGCLIATSIWYHDFSKLLITFIYFESILIYIILITAMFAYIFENLLAAFIANLFFWIFGVILSTVNSTFEYLSYFDAALIRHEIFGKFLGINKPENINVFGGLLYNLIVFILVLAIIFFLGKRWEKNGI